MDEPTTPWRGRRVLVTGCTGFLGGAVVRELLSRGAEVVGLIRDRASDAEFARHRLTGRVHVIHGRVEDAFRIHSALAVYEVQTVLHLATADPSLLDRGTTTVLEAVRRYDPRVAVVVASPTAAPDAAARAPLVPSVPVGIARFGELFGGGDRKTFRVVPATIMGLLTGDRNVPAFDSPRRDFVFVQDAARACLRLAESVADRPGPHIEDVAFRSGWSMGDREMAAAIRDVFAHRFAELALEPVAPNPLGWIPKISLTEAVAETINWYREFLRTRFFGTKPSAPTHRAAA